MRVKGYNISPLVGNLEEGSDDGAKEEERMSSVGSIDGDTDGTEVVASKDSAEVITKVTSVGQDQILYYAVDGEAVGLIEVVSDDIEPRPYEGRTEEILEGK